MPRGRTVNQIELSELMGVEQSTVRAWRERGMPYVQKSDGTAKVPWLFNVRACLDWHVAEEAKKKPKPVAMPDDMDELKKRKLAAEAEMVELELAQARGEVASISDFERAQSKLNATIRQNMMNVPSRAVLQLLGETDETEFKNKLRAEIMLALEQSANEELDDPADGDDE
jgi:phage terminase Nu1 subunit (DNA packaging protein)